MLAMQFSKSRAPRSSPTRKPLKQSPHPVPSVAGRSGGDSLTTKQRVRPVRYPPGAGRSPKIRGAARPDGAVRVE